MSPVGSKNAPEAKAREKIDALLAQAGWLVQDREDMNLTASDGIAVREFKLEKGHGYVDYLLFVDGKPLASSRRSPLATRSRASRSRPRNTSRACRRR